MAGVRIFGVNRELRRLQNELDEAVDRAVRTRAFVAEGNLKQATPVKTGRARDSWQFRRTATGPEIVNPVNYIGELNMGSSRQAPANFVEAAVLQSGFDAVFVEVYRDPSNDDGTDGT